MEGKITLSDLEDKAFKSKLKQLDGNTEASFTHYLHNQHNGIAGFYKRDALKHISYFLAHKFPKEEISDKLLNSALKHLVSSYESVQFPSSKNPKFKFIDLFAGIGGFRLAMQNVGGKCIYTSEWDKFSKRTYKANFGEVPFGDITQKATKDYIPEQFELLCAGFPCQAFSLAGHKKGFSDTRGTLFFDVEQIIEKHRPKVVFLENVKNLVSHDKGRTFKIILEILEEKLGYKAFYRVVNTMTHTNIPQNRERIFVVAFDPNQVKDYQSFTFPKPISLTSTIHDFLDAGRQADKYYYSSDSKYYPKLKDSMTNPHTVYQWRRVYVRENKKGVCPTLTANMGTGGHNVPLIIDDYGFRKLTPRECFALQGFPMEKYTLPKLSDSKLYMQAGNSVTTTLIERIGNEIMKVL